MSKKIIEQNQQNIISDLPLSTAVRGASLGSMVGTQLGDLLDGIMLTPTDDIIPPYWSKNRDKFLRQWVKRVDVLSLCQYTFSSKATTINLNLVPDGSVEYTAEEIQSIESITFAKFRPEFTKFVQAFLSQDNGAFMALLGNSEMVMGPDDKERPAFIKPQPLGNNFAIGVTGLKTLDSANCQRTGVEEWPLIYRKDGSVYLLHYSRVIMMSDMPSSKEKLNGVGFCAASRCATAAEYSNNIATLEGEVMGSRPLIRILYASSGMTKDGLESALKTWGASLDNQALSRYGKVMALAPEALGGEPLELKTLSLSPEPQDTLQKEIFRAAVMAACYGLTLRDIGIAGLTSGQTRADAEVQQAQARLKGVWDFLTQFEAELNQKVMPKGLTAVFDVQDDAQDQMQLDMQETVSKRQERDIELGLIDERTARLELQARNYLTVGEFERLEAESGRDVHGMPITISEYRRITGKGMIPDEVEEEPEEIEENE